MPLEDFLSRVAQETGVSGGGASRVELLSGFPPAPLALPEEKQGQTLASLGLASGDALMARQGAPSAADIAAAEAEAAEAAARAAASAAARSDGAAAASSPLSGPNHHPSSAAAAAAAADWSSLVGGDDLLDEDAALAAAIAASLQDSEGGGAGGGRGDATTSAASAASAPSFPKPAAAAAAPPPRRNDVSDGPNFGDMRSLIASRATANDRGNAGSINQGSAPTVSLRDGSAIARRVVDADNSCLFASVGYVMEGTRSAAPKLRALVAKAVVSDPVTYSEAFLGGERAFFFFF